jgi:hypothetical protein
MNWFPILLGLIVFVCVCLPCPPIREWLDNTDREPSDDC